MLASKSGVFMNKGDLVDKVAETAHVTSSQADEVLKAALSIIIDAVASGDKVTLVGFGGFEGRVAQRVKDAIPKPMKSWKYPQPAYRLSPLANYSRKKLHHKRTQHYQANV
jgi:DNA-binding protein HU-beta